MENEYREEGSSIVGPKKQKKQSKSSLTSSELNILKEQGIEYLEEQRNKTTVQFVDVMCGDAWKKKGYHGPVICNYDDGSEYQGEWQDGKRHGMIKRTNSQIRKLRGTTTMSKQDGKIVKSYMPYSLRG